MQKNNLNNKLQYKNISTLMVRDEVRATKGNEASSNQGTRSGAGRPDGCHEPERKASSNLECKVLTAS